MELAFRTNLDTINSLRNEVGYEADNYSLKRKNFKRSIKQLIQPKDGILNGSTIKDIYFPSTTLGGTKYDFFISHSHNNEEEAIVLANWLEYYYNCSCFIDSLAWKSSDELLREIDNVYCYKRHSKTYDYIKRNFTTSHVHAILSMALLDTIINSRYCIFIESDESISLRNGLNKKTFSPWLYEEIKYMTILQSTRKTKTFSMADSLNEGFKIEYDTDGLEKFQFLDINRIKQLEV